MTASVSSARSLVEDQHYYDLNLRANRIYIREPFSALPKNLADLVSSINTARDWTGPGSVAQARLDRALHNLEDAAVESDVEQYFSQAVFVVPPSGGPLRRTDRLPMNKVAVPRTSAQYSISTPAPDMLYGYGLHAFLPPSRQALLSLGSHPFANTTRLVYPFLVVEFKGEDGSLWVATNQCVGGSVSCVHMVEQLHQKLLQGGVRGLEPEDRVAFSVAVSGTEARIYLSWLDGNGLDYAMQKIRSFCLQEPDQFVQFRCYVNNILEWGRTTRLRALASALGRLPAPGGFRMA